MSSKYPFSSGLLRELLNQIRAKKLGEGAQRWANVVEDKHSVDLVQNHCVQFSASEIDQANGYIQQIRDEFGQNLVKTFPRPAVNPHLVAARAFLETCPIREHQLPRIEDGSMSDELQWRSFCQSTGSEVTFEDFINITSVYRPKHEVLRLEPPSHIKPHLCSLSELPCSWSETLQIILPKTNPSEVIASYQRVQITRGDIATVLPTDAMAVASLSSRKGWLNDSMIDIFLRTVTVAKNTRYKKKSSLVINSYIVDKIETANPKISAKSAGLDDSTLPDIDLILFPTYVGNHWILIAAFPKKRSLLLYDSLSANRMNQLIIVRDWIKAVTGEAQGENWDMEEVDCPQQTDESVCGVFVCINGLHVVFGRNPMGVYSQESSDFLREYVAAVICKGEYPFDD